jgi:hypothetical protein
MRWQRHNIYRGGFILQEMKNIYIIRPGCLLSNGPEATLIVRGTEGFLIPVEGRPVNAVLTIDDKSISSVKPEFVGMATSLRSFDGVNSLEMGDNGIIIIGITPNDWERGRDKIIGIVKSGIAPDGGPVEVGDYVPGVVMLSVTIVSSPGSENPIVKLMEDIVRSGFIMGWVRWSGLSRHGISRNQMVRIF